MARNMHRYEELTPYEFDREKERASIVYVAASPLEYHEECNVLGTDTNKGYDWCLAAAEITGGIVFPMLPVAPAGLRPYLSREQLRSRYSDPHYREAYGEYFGSLYPSIFFSREVCMALYRELLEMLAEELQFKLCVFVGSHGPAGNMIKDIIVREDPDVQDAPVSTTESFVGNFHGMCVMACGSFDYSLGAIRQFNQENGIPKAFHGGLWESAFNYAIDPEYFQPEMLDQNQYPQHYGPLPEQYTETPNRPCKQEFRCFSPEWAKQLRDTTVKALAEAVLKQYAKIP